MYLPIGRKAHEKGSQDSLYELMESPQRKLAHLSFRKFFEFRAKPIGAEICRLKIEALQYAAEKDRISRSQKMTRNTIGAALAGCLDLEPGVSSEVVEAESQREVLAAHLLKTSRKTRKKTTPAASIPAATNCQAILNASARRKCRAEQGV